MFVKIVFWLNVPFNTLRRDVILEAVERHIPELLPYASASYSGDSDLQFGEFLAARSQEGAQQGTCSGSSTSAWPSTICRDIAAVVDCCWLSGRHVDGGRGKTGWRRTSLGWRRAQRSSASHSTNPSVEVAGLTNVTRSILGRRARGGASGRFHWRTWFSSGSPLRASRGVDTVLSSKRGDLETLASRLPPHAGPRQPLPPAQRRDHATSHVHDEDGAMHGQQGELELYGRVCAAVNPVRNPQRGLVG